MKTNIFDLKVKLTDAIYYILLNIDITNILHPYIPIGYLCSPITLYILLPENKNVPLSILNILMVENKMLRLGLLE